VEGRAWTIPPTHDLALRRQREVFRDLAVAWVTAYPASAEAMEALALSLELLGNPACLDTLQRARGLATGAGERTRLAAQEVWVRLKFTLPGSPAGFAAARARADSLLRANPPGRAAEPGLMASLAAMRGRAGTAAALSRQAAAPAGRIVPVASDAAALLVFAALGGPVDSVLALEQAVLRHVGADPAAPASRQAAAVLERAAMVAFPHLRLSSLARAVTAGDYTAAAESAFARGDTAEVYAVLDRMHAARRTLRPADLTIDNIYVEAWLLASSGDTAGAVARLDPTLDALAFAPPRTLYDPVRAAGLVRAMALRADLAARTGDTTTARRWARAVADLWSRSDPFLRPASERMGALAR
jgi:hypothetical protein